MKVYEVLNGKGYMTRNHGIFSSLEKAARKAKDVYLEALKQGLTDEQFKPWIEVHELDGDGVIQTIPWSQI